MYDSEGRIWKLHGLCFWIICCCGKAVACSTYMTHVELATVSPIAISSFRICELWLLWVPFLSLISIVCCFPDPTNIWHLYFTGIAIRLPLVPLGRHAAAIVFHNFHTGLWLIECQSYKMSENENLVQVFWLFFFNLGCQGQSNAYVVSLCYSSKGRIGGLGN